MLTANILVPASRKATSIGHLVERSASRLNIPAVSAVSRIYGLPGIDARNISDSRRQSRGRLRGSKVQFRPVCLGFEQFGTSAGDRAFGLVNGNLGRCPDLNPYVARFCGRPLLCRHSIVDRAFHRQFSCATIFPLAASKSWKYQGFGSRTADFHLGRSDQSLEAARKSQKCARQAELGHGRDLEFTTFHRLGLAGAGFFKKGMRGAPPPPPSGCFFELFSARNPPVRQNGIFGGSTQKHLLFLYIYKQGKGGPPRPGWFFSSPRRDPPPLFREGIFVEGAPARL